MSFFGIRISTYRRKTGTFHLLGRCLKSVLNQTFTDWKVFLIGDNYDSNEEFEVLSGLIPNDKIYSENLTYSPERSKYEGAKLWSVAGFTASCTGLKKIQEERIPIHVPLDDDDWWHKNHLKTLWEHYQKFPEAAFIYTRSTYKNKVLPHDIMPLRYNNLPPRAYNLVHSSVSWNVEKIPLMYKNVIKENSKFVAGDALMWETIKNYCESNKLKTLYIPEITVYHDTEHGDKQMEPMLL
jgi:glycosyltransferase involved in cell wall biosynthesis